MAVALDAVLAWRGQAWSLADWASSVVLGALVTVTVGILLARRQSLIQEALADLELVEKVAVLSAQVPHLRNRSSSGEIVRVCYDARAGMALLPLARGTMQTEYLETVGAVLDEIERRLATSLDLHATWTGDEWDRFHDVVSRLAEAARVAARRSAIVRAHRTATIDPVTRRLGAFTGTRVPFEVFHHHYTRGRDRIRVRLDWDRFARLVDAPGGGVRIERVQTVIEPRDLAALAPYRSPWYHDPAFPSRGEVDHDDPGAHPIRHEQAVHDRTLVAPGRDARITAVEDWYSARAISGPIHLTLATWAVAPDRILVLDGNHRLAAVARLVGDGCPATITEFRITGAGAVLPPLVPDLAHHLTGPIP
ncbi:hypothetical protein B4N89_46780 [Embleya scabrispora]|uniref:Uncharacterized protein n=1 Tax=Embleya scabrispora TaxID=159449 RepID=A0A1T3NI97_9ACTN|nr:hypothetical protein [Embleya scabrispora]OPC76523.1 hypothetical protein B4N89_46780 [Embleya scabrispora]